MPYALIETVRVKDGIAPLWDLHMGRLTRSAIELRLPLPDLTPPRGGDDRVVRFEVSRHGVRLSEREVGSTAAVSLMRVRAPHEGYPHKVSERAWLEAARTLLPDPEADALLFDGEGRLIEATIWAVGWWEGETLCFPPLALGGLPSVARARLSEMVRGGVRDSVLLRDEIRRRPLLACNAARGVVGVEVIDGVPAAGNHRTEALAERFWNRAHA